MSARFEPGQRLTVRAISAAFGVSTMPVRAAFARLAAERAVTPLANGTIAIPRLTRDRFDELVELRLLLEGKAAEKAATRVTDADLADLQRICDDLAASAAAGDVDAYLRRDQGFKFQIYRIARAPALADLIERIWLQIGPLLRLYGSDIRNPAAGDGRAAIIAALAGRDGERTRLALENDIRRGTTVLLRLARFDAAGGDESPESEEPETPIL